MKNKRMKVLLLCGFSIFLLSNCKQTPSPNMEKIVGEWKIGHSELNGNVNQMMENGFLIFNDKNTVVTNFFGEKQEFSFELDGTLLILKGTPMPFEMETQFINSDSLMLSGTVSPNKKTDLQMLFGLSRITK